jgi:hypothetical protein
MFYNVFVRFTGRLCRYFFILITREWLMGLKPLAHHPIIPMHSAWPNGIS